MRGKQKKPYVPKALDYFAKSLLRVRGDTGKGKIGEPKLSLDLEGLQNAMQRLPAEDRKSIERFWGLTGGPNYSQMPLLFVVKDADYIGMQNAASQALGRFLTLDYIIMFDPIVGRRVESIVKKVNKNGLEISDTECVKYLMAFFIYVDNGPKMSFEEDDMSIAEDLDGNHMFEEYTVLKQMCEEIRPYPDQSINLKLLVNFFEMLDFKDVLTIKKSIGIEIPRDTPRIKKSVEIEIPKEMLPVVFKSEDFKSIEVVRTASGIRKLKERIFPYGAWEVTSALIMRNFAEKINLHDFMQELDAIRKDWAKVVEFKSGEHVLKTMSGVRNLIVYDIGGLKFTDLYEVMFLYLERNLIAPEL